MTCKLTQDITLIYRGKHEVIDSDDLNKKSELFHDFDMCNLAALTQQSSNDSTFVLNEHDIERLIKRNFGRVLLKYHFSDVMDMDDLYRVSVRTIDNSSISTDALEKKAMYIGRVLKKAVDEVLEELGFEDMDRADLLHSFSVWIASNACPPSASACFKFRFNAMSPKDSRGFIKFPSEKIVHMSDDQLRGILKHELTHHIIKQIGAVNRYDVNPVRWLSEGLAEYIENKIFSKKVDAYSIFNTCDFDQLSYDELPCDQSYDYLKAQLALVYARKIGPVDGIKKIAKAIAHGQTAKQAIQTGLGVDWETFRAGAHEFVEQEIKNKSIRDALAKNPSVLLELQIASDDAWRKGYALSVGTGLATILESYGSGLELYLKYQYMDMTDPFNYSIRRFKHRLDAGARLLSPYLFRIRDKSISFLGASLSLAPSLHMITEETYTGEDLRGRPLYRTEEHIGYDMNIGGEFYPMESRIGLLITRIGIGYERGIISDTSELSLQVLMGWQF